MIQRYFEINQNGHNIRCKLYCGDSKNIRRVFLFCHGFGGHRDNTAAEKFAQRLTTKYKGTALVTFNLPCHGDDVKKKLVLSDCDTYLNLVISFLQQKYQPERLYCYATSFGGYLILKYIHDHGNPFHKIVLRCPAVNMREALTTVIMSPEELEKLKKGKEIPVGFDRKIPVNPAFLEELSANDIRVLDFLDYAEDILILHGTADEIISFDTVKAFAEEQLMEFAPIPGADHRFRDPAKMEQAIRQILEFCEF